MRLRVKFNKRNYLKYIGHLDLMRLFQRSLNRAGVPVKYSKGFNPQPRFAIASPLSLGIEGQEEYMDIELLEEVDIEGFIEDMNRILPRDIEILACYYTDSKDSIAALVSYGHYEISLDNPGDLDGEEVENLLASWLDQDQILISRLRKKGRKKIEVEEDIIPLIKKLSLKEAGPKIVLEAVVKLGDGGNLRPFDLMDAFLRDHEVFDLDKDTIGYNRIGLYIEKGNTLVKPF